MIIAAFWLGLAAVLFPQVSAGGALVLGIALWLIVGTGTLSAIMAGWVH